MNRFAWDGRGGDAWEARLKPVNAKGKAVPVAISDQGNGSYACSYTVSQVLGVRVQGLGPADQNQNPRFRTREIDPTRAPTPFHRCGVFRLLLGIRVWEANLDVLGLGVWGLGLGFGKSTLTVWFPEEKCSMWMVILRFGG
jgi:hypothetical protein